jgi:hypothetical protein
MGERKEDKEINPKLPQTRPASISPAENRREEEEDGKKRLSRTLKGKKRVGMTK